MLVAYSRFERFHRRQNLRFNTVVLDVGRPSHRHITMPQDRPNHNLSPMPSSCRLVANPRRKACGPCRPLDADCEVHRRVRQVASKRPHAQAPTIDRIDALPAAAVNGVPRLLAEAVDEMTGLARDVWARATAACGRSGDEALTRVMKKLER